ncbi:MAG: sigma-54-dependent Fis family transcriptional regulator [Nitrospinota bacterium]|nr:sigma-54-dependent Fis family transcriptional regulator [Nitrospinota bacterium]
MINGDPFAELLPQDRLRALEALYRLVCAINSRRDLATMATNALEGIISFMRVDAGIIYTIDKKEQVVAVANQNISAEVCRDLATRPVKVGECLCGAIASSQEEIVILSNASADRRITRDSVRQEGMEFYAGFPLISAGKTVGVLCVISHEKYRLDPAGLPVLRQITSPLAIAMENATLMGRLENEKETLEKENIHLRQLATLPRSANPLIGSSQAMNLVYKIIQQAAMAPSCALIYGESGTGKELAAQTIHALGPRKKGPFIAINCGAIAESVIESELFGHEKGAFTGAESMRRGYLEQAHAGTLFLDEIHLLSPGAQVKVLRAVQEKVIFRLGGEKPVKIDFRILASSNIPLEDCVRDGSFRKDLFYRLNVIRLNMPPLRERKEDIPALAWHFAKTFAGAMETSISRIDPNAAEALASYDWPGNVRELQNAMERALVFSSGPTVTLKDIQPFFKTQALLYPAATVGTLEKLETEEILKAMSAANGNKREAARLLGIHPTTLWRKLGKLQSKSLQ